MLTGRKIHLCVCGGIAAYKAVETVRLLQKAGAQVQVAMTANAQAFVGPMTFQALTHAPVLTRTLDPGEEMAIGHIAFAQSCDVLLFAPCTANMLGKIAHGLGDDVVSTIALAAPVGRTPVLIAPAMNTAMWENPATQANLALVSARGYRVLLPDAGALACGAVGPGRLPEPEALVAAVMEALAPRPLTGRRVLITAGPTREPIDPARFLSNASTGKAGFAIAAAAVRAGAAVTLVHGPVTVPVPPGVEAVAVTTAREMHREVMARWAVADAIVMSAAVADYRPAEVFDHKVKKLDGPMTLTLVRNPDILAEVGAARTGAHPVLVGFAAETGHPVEYARDKLVRKRCDLIVANDVSAPGAGFGTDTNLVYLVTAEGAEPLPLQSKEAIGQRIVDFLAVRLADGR
ncbi:bifunctional phosphopantothenoylcysteine decarboxylase/phosphopantothenate--cysteine ligase CoaBC [Myxococcota bacterium]|nr:bifunctional phosphopantothenoylcysteine decarboxylase/phosphopantothenate--cysteine ligase CoaBC [Myxococcota bacterium]